MGTLNMKVLAVLVSVVACAAAQNVVCGKGSSTNKEVTVEDKKTYTFKTQKGKKYKGNTECTVKYKMGDSCAKMSFVCTKGNIHNKDRKKCMKGDKLTVTANGKPKAYCGKYSKKKQVKVSSAGDMSVVFTSDKKKHSTGAVCKVKCTEAAGSTTETPDPVPIETVTRVKLELFTGQTETEEPISFDGESLTLPSDTQFDPSKPIKVVTHGWEESRLTIFGNAVVDMNGLPRSFNKLYMDSGYDYTVLGVHWVPIEGWKEDLMNASSSDAANTLGRAMHTLFQKYNVSVSQVHMIGFSMGTVVTSKTAKKLQELGNGPPGRLTLLDPCPYSQANVISKTDGVFVEAIHTSSQGICSEAPLAHVDYYPNGGDAQPCGSDSCSCPYGGKVCSTCYHGAARCRTFFFGDPDWLVNHFRAVELYRESIGSPSSFQSWKCSKTYGDFVSSDRSCPEKGERIPMGEHSVDQGRPGDGLYFLTTAGVSPYSL